MSINWKKSAELNRCTVDDLKIWFEKYPKSHKRVIAICEGNYNCDEREVYFHRYTDLCRSCASKKRYEDPKEHEKQSKGQKKRYKDPKEHEKQSTLNRKRWEDPKERKKQSVMTSKRYAEMDDPKLEMCIHHYIYDFNDLNKYTIEVTRSEHSTIHNNLRRIGLEVPHINIMVND